MISVWCSVGVVVGVVDCKCVVCVGCVDARVGAGTVGDVGASGA